MSERIGRAKKHNIARLCGEPQRDILKIVHKARDLGRYASNPSLLEIEAMANLQIGNLLQALDLCAQAKNILVSCGMHRSASYLTVCDTHADVHFQKSEYVEARQLHEQIVKETSPTTAARFHANSLVSIAQLDVITECPVLVAGILANINAAKAIWQSLGNPRVLSLCSLVTAELKLYCGDVGEACKEFLQCLNKSQGLYMDLQMFCLAALGDPRNGMHTGSETFHWAVVSLAFVQKMKDHVGTLNALRRLADVHSISKGDETALSLFHTALEGGTNMDIHRLRAECMVGIADIMLRHGNLVQAKEMWTDAHPLFVQSSRMKDAIAVKEQLQQLSKNSLLNKLKPASAAATTVEERLQQLPNTLLLNRLEPVPEIQKTNNDWFKLLS
ncbi:hypothetical protein K438DRAFT_1778003 [Mycena galopus ATCC 62051]|nr:hypothetical protein K438DRAFT_1778003 [Mycena galopus ATCC 62051]